MRNFFHLLPNSCSFLEAHLKKYKIVCSLIITAILLNFTFLNAAQQTPTSSDSIPLNPEKIFNNDTGLRFHEQIDLFLTGKISFFDNYSSDLLIYFADTLYAGELADHKEKIAEIEKKSQTPVKVPGSPDSQLDIPVISFKKTLAFLDEIIEKRPNDYYIDRFIYFRSFCYQEQGDIDKAFEGFQTIIEKFPKSTLFNESLFRIGEYFFTTEQYGLALENYQKIISDPLAKESNFYNKAIYKTAWAYYVTSSYSEAIDYFLRLADLSYPADLQKQESKRKSEIKQLNKEDLSDEALRYAAISYSTTANSKENLAILEKTLKPYSEKIYIYLASAYFDHSKFEDFIEIYNAYFAKFNTEPEELEIEHRIVEIQKITLSDEKRSVAEKDRFINDFYPGGPRYEKNRFINKDKLDFFLAPMLKDNAKYYHEKGQTSADKTQFFKNAVDLYKLYLGLYSKEKGANMINFFLADALFESENFSEAALEYEKVASWVYDDKTINEKALYGVLLCYENILKAAPTKNPEEIREKLIASEKKYLDTFPVNIKSAPLFYRDGERNFDKKNYIGAIDSFKKARNLFTDEAKKLIATELIADSYFNLMEYFYAVIEYEELLKAALRENKSDSVQKAQRFIPICHMHIGDDFKNNDKIMAAARRYEKAAMAFQTEEDKKNAMTEAMKMYISIRDWNEFDKALQRFKSLSSDSETFLKILIMASKVSEENFDFLSAGKYFEITSTITSKPDEKLKLLLSAANNFEKGANFNKAIELFSTTYDSNLVTPTQELEYRYKVAEIFVKKGEPERAKALYEEIVTLHKNFTQKGTAGNKYFFAKSTLNLLDETYDSFVAMKLDPPFETNMKSKLGLMEKLISGFMDITRLEITEFSTLSLYKIGKSFENFRESIINSPVPADLVEEEKEEYKFMLEERAFPYEEKSVKSYEKVIQLGRKLNISDEYIDLSYVRLAQISPAIYKRDEEQFEIKLIPLQEEAGLIETIDYDLYKRDKDNEELWIK